jgi:hypothetical protein
MRRYMSATTIGITWTEIWVGDGSAEVDQSLGPLGRHYYPIGLAFFFIFLLFHRPVF